MLMMLRAAYIEGLTSKRRVNQSVESIVPVGKVVGHLEEFVTGVVELY